MCLCVLEGAPAYGRVLHGSLGALTVVFPLQEREEGLYRGVKHSEACSFREPRAVCLGEGSLLAGYPAPFPSPVLLPWRICLDARV